MSKDPCLTKFTGGNVGWDIEREKTLATFEVGKEYRIIGGSMGQTHCRIEIEGVSGSWNSVFFDVDIHKCPAIRNEYARFMTSRKR